MTNYSFNTCSIYQHFLRHFCHYTDDAVWWISIHTYKISKVTAIQHFIKVDSIFIIVYCMCSMGYTGIKVTITVGYIWYNSYCFLGGEKKFHSIFAEVVPIFVICLTGCILSPLQPATSIYRQCVLAFSHTTGCHSNLLDNSPDAWQSMNLGYVKQKCSFCW